MRGPKSVVVPLLIFVFTTVAAWASGTIVDVGHGVSTVWYVVGYGLQTAVWLSAAFVLIRLMQFYIWDRLVAKYLGAPTPRLIIDIVSGIILALAVTGILHNVFKQDVSKIWATSGLIGLVLGLSLQTIILDLFSGLAIQLDRPFGMGDWIKLYGVATGINAKVLEINWRTTRLKTETNELVVVPNSVLGKMVLSNYNQPDLPTRFQVEVCLDFSESVERCRRLLLAAAKGTDGVLEEPAPAVLIGEANQSGLKYIVRFWVKPWSPYSPTTASSMVLTSIVQNLQFAGIDQSYPKTVYVNPVAAGQVEQQPQLDRQALLRKLPLFRSLMQDELQKLADSATTQFCQQGDTLIREGETGDSMYVLVEGLLDVYRASIDNGDTRVGRIQPGRFFGEMSLLTGEPRSATIRASLDAVVLKIEKSVFADLLVQRPELVDQLSRVLAERKIADKLREADSQKSLEEQTTSLADQIKKKIVGFFQQVFPLLGR